MTSTVEVPPPTLEEVTDGVFAYIQLHGQWGLNNAGFLLGSDSVTLVDTCFTERRARALADAVKRTAGDRPIRTLVNTHHHGDHTYGNFVFGPGVTIIGHDKCRAEMVATGLSLKTIWPDVDWGELEIVPPNVTFGETLTIYVDDLRVDLIYVGPAHTTNDIVAWVPEKRTLFTGDVVFNGGTPFTIFGSVAGSIDALDILRNLNPERIVPGHGPVCDAEVFDDIEAYLRFIQETAERGFKADATPLDLARDTDLGRFAELHDTERFPANLHRAYSELRGEPRGVPIPLAQIMPDMVAYNGGEMPRCLA